MTVYAWPSNWFPSRFEMRILYNTRTFVGPYTPTTQVLNLLGERWTVSLDLSPDRDPVLGAAREAYFDRLGGPLNQIAMPYLKRLYPQGTMRGSPTLTASVAQLANLISITTTAAATLYAGDMIGINGQLVRVMANATADGAGAMPNVEVAPRMRTAVTLGAAVTWSAPTVNMILKSDGVPVVYRPGLYEMSTLDLIEAL
jgi:hypothetical protein